VGVCVWGGKNSESFHTDSLQSLTDKQAAGSRFSLHVSELGAKASRSASECLI
jgi:hypothetical protein